MKVKRVNNFEFAGTSLETTPANSYCFTQKHIAENAGGVIVDTHESVSQDNKSSVLLIPQTLFDSFDEVRKFTALERIKAGTAKVIPDEEWYP